jgi:hypothetical protein
MSTLWDAVARLLGSGAASSVLSGDMRGDPNYRHSPGRDPDSACWAQISRCPLETGVRVPSAPRRQAVGEGLRGFIAGSDAGRQTYEDDLSRGIGRWEIEAQRSQTDGVPFDDKPAPGAVADMPPIAAAWAEDQIDHMPLFQLSRIDPVQLSPSARHALSRRLYQEGF